MVILRTDNAPEYQSHEANSFYNQRMIKHETTAPYTPQQNSVAESNIRTIIRMARAMRIHSKLPEEFSWYAVKYAEVIYNCTTTKGLVNKTPYEAWTGRRPDLSRFKIFGCKCWIKIP